MTERLIPSFPIGLGSTKCNLSVSSITSTTATSITSATKRIPFSTVAFIPVTSLAAPATSTVVPSLSPVLPASILPASTSQSSLLQQPLVILDQLTHLVGELEGEGVDTVLLQLEHLGQDGDVDAVIDVAVGEQVCPHTLLLYLSGQHFPDRVSIIEQIPDLGIHLVIDNEIASLLPVSVPHCLAGSHNMFPHTLWRTNQRLSLRTSQLLIVRFTNHPPPGVVLVGSKIRDLNEHGGDQVDTFQKLQINVHVEWHLSCLLNLLLFTTSQDLLVLSLGQQSLSDQFLASTSKLNVKKSIVRVLDLSMSKSAKAQLHNGPVVQDLSHRI